MAVLKKTVMPKNTPPQPSSKVPPKTTINTAKPTVQPKPVSNSPVGTTNIHGNVSRDITKFDDKTKAWEMQYLDNYKNGISSSNESTANLLKAKYGIVDKPAFDQEAYLKNMQDQINGMYAKQQEAQLAQFKAQRDKAVGEINQQKAALAPQYADMRNQADVVNAQNVSKLRELMAANGLSTSGESVTGQVGLQSARQGALSQLNLQEQQQRNDFDRRITDLNNPAEEQAMIAALESERMRAMYDATMRADEVGYSRGRDAVMDQRYTSETNYSRGRDTIADQQWQKQWNAQEAQRALDNYRQKQEWNYNVGRDKVADGRYNNEWKYRKEQDALAKAERDREYKNMTEQQRREFEWNKQVHGEEMAWRNYEMEYQGNLQSSMSQAEIDYYRSVGLGDFLG
jgi:hypothetical protein